MRDLAVTSDALRIPFTYQVVIFLTAAVVFLIGVMHPYYNWDIIGYVAAAHYEDGSRGEVLRDRTYDEIRTEVGKYQFEHLTDGPYRQTVYEYPQSLQQQVPFYSIRSSNRAGARHEFRVVLCSARSGSARFSRRYRS
jgi:hypothetical protein